MELGRSKRRHSSIKSDPPARLTGWILWYLPCSLQTVVPLLHTNAMARGASGGVTVLIVLAFCR